MEVIDKINECEAQAVKIIDRANETAKKTAEQAKVESAGITEKIIGEYNLKAQEIVAQAQDNAQQLYKRISVGYDEKCVKIKASAKQNMDKAADAIIKAVV